VDHEVADVAMVLMAEMADLASNPANLMMEAVHAVAYSGGLGQPLVATPVALSKFTGDLLANFVQTNYTAGGGPWRAGLGVGLRVYVEWRGGGDIMPVSLSFATLGSLRPAPAR
jgi:hypothetical protein